MAVWIGFMSDADPTKQASRASALSLGFGRGLGVGPAVPVAVPGTVTAMPVAPSTPVPVRRGAAGDAAARGPGAWNGKAGSTFFPASARPRAKGTTP